MNISFTIPGKIKGKARPRVMKNGHTFTPADTVAYENWIKICFQDCLKWNAIDKYEISLKPLQVEIMCYFQRPKNHYNTKGQLKPNAPFYHTGKPDSDNIAKCMDALNKIAWKDDSQICKLSVVKLYSSKASEYMDVTFWEID